MAEIFGAVAAGIALSNEMIRIGRSIRKATKRVQHARRDFAELADEAIIFAGLYNRFLRTCGDDLKSCRDTAAAFQRLDKWARANRRGLRKIQRECKALRSNDKYGTSISETVAAHVKWFFNKDSVEGLQVALRVAREYINGFSTLTYIKKLEQELEMLRHALDNIMERQILEEQLGMPLEEKIKELKDEVHSNRTVYRTNERILVRTTEKLIMHQKKHLSTDVVPAPDELYELTESFVEYAENIVPPRRFEDRNHSPVPIHRSVSTAEIAHSKVRPPVADSTYTLYRSPSPKMNVENLSTGSTNERSTRASSHSSRSSKRPGILSSSISDLTPISTSSSTTPPASNKAIKKPSITTKEFTETDDAKVDDDIEPNDHRPREYINDPEGTILARPKVKSRSSSTAPHPNSPTRVLRAERIGPHTISICPLHVHVNRHALSITDAELAETFFQALRNNNDKIQMLDDVLTERDERIHEWHGIPGWTVYPLRVSPSRNHAQECHNASW